jgi:3alpha(or 20beta)-hydroxysteroid dehydrogenase
MNPLRKLPDMAFSLQSEIYFAGYVVWEDPADDARHRGWLAERMAEIEPIADGCYLGDSDFTTRPARFMSDAAWARSWRCASGSIPTSGSSAIWGRCYCMADVGGRVAGRVIVVTGAASGQGAAEAAALAAEGAEIIAADLRAPQAADRVHPFELDVSDPAGWEALAAFARERFGRVDGLVNNAGITSRVRIGHVALDDWNRILAVNVTGPMLGIQALLPLMGAGASIVNVGSVAGLTGHYTAAYTTSKWALRGLTQACAVELGQSGIRVNAVHPGYVETPMTAGAPAAFRAANIAVTPLGRAGRPEDLAPLMVFLLSEESAYINGVDVPVDGGLSKGGVAKYFSDAVRREGV